MCASLSVCACAHVHTCLRVGFALVIICVLKGGGERGRERGGGILENLRCEGRGCEEGGRMG